MMTQWSCFSWQRHERLAIAAVFTVIALVSCLACPRSACGQAPGRLVAPNGKSLSGTILGTSPTDVEIENEDGDLKRVPLDKIVELQFSDEPPS